MSCFNRVLFAFGIVSLLLIAVANASDPIRVGPKQIKPATVNVGERFSNVSGMAVDGRTFDLGTCKDFKATVIAMTSTSCPICKKYAPSLAQIEKQFAGKNIQFCFLNSIASDKADDIQTVIKTTELSGPYIHDQEESLTRSLKVRTTAEVYVFDSAQTLVYRGAVDDQFGLGYSGKDALTFLDQAKKLIKKDLQQSDLAARYFFHLAQVNALAANVPASLANAKTGFQTYVSSSKRLFQIAAAYKMDLASAYTERTAGVIYSELLNEPTAADWISSPLEAFTFLLSPIQDARLRWFQIAMNRKEYEMAMEIADNVRRFQFYNSMPLGGRLLAFRWMMEAPETMLPKEAVEQRKIFNLANPNYAGLSNAGSNIEAELRKIDGVPDLSTDEGKLQINLVNELTKNSLQRELLLLNASLKRNPAPMSFPPRLDFGELQKRMDPKQAAWIFFAQGKVFYSFILTKDSYKLEKLVPITTVKRYLPILLKKMGNIGPRLASVSQKILESDDWKEPALKLMEVLQPKNVDWEQYDELVIVPDGMLWYLPFDALQVGKEGTSQNLADKVAIRYAPTVSTIVPDGRKIRPQTNTTVIAGRLVRGQEPEVNETEIAKLQKVLPSTSILSKKIGFDSASYSSQIDTLVIWDEIEQAERIAGYEWSPLQVDKGAPRSSVGTWMSLPFYGPEQYIIPGFNTAAGSGKVTGNGNEIFLTVCGMMASGARTVLLSRWAVGGENDFNLTREFLAELKNDSAAQAWRRARELSILNDINPDREPRIRSITGDVALKTDHPFFWAGYMLIDTGVKPVKEVQEIEADE